MAWIIVVSASRGDSVVRVIRGFLCSIVVDDMRCACCFIFACVCIVYCGRCGLAGYDLYTHGAHEVKTGHDNATTMKKGCTCHLRVLRPPRHRYDCHTTRLRGLGVRPLPASPPIHMRITSISTAGSERHKPTHTSEVESSYMRRQSSGGICAMIGVCAAAAATPHVLGGSAACGAMHMPHCAPRDTRASIAEPEPNAA